jgi:hypothetical protein
MRQLPPKATLSKPYDDVTKRTQMSTPPTIPGAIPSETRVSVIRLTAAGGLSAGSGPPEMIERVAYAAQLADLIGELLGAGPFEFVEVALPAGGCVIAREPTGALTAAATSDGSIDLAMLRKRLVGPPERP